MKAFIARPADRTLVVISVLAFIEGSSTSIVRPFIAPYAATLGASVLVIGVAVTLAQLPGLLLAVPLGSAINRIGIRRILVCGVLLLGSGTLVMALSRNVAGLLLSQVVIGLGTLAAGLSLQALATSPVAELDHDPRLVTGLTTFTLVGGLVGPVVAGTMIDRYGYPSAFGSVAVLCSLSAATAMLLPRIRRLRESAPVGGTRAPSPNRVLHSLHRLASPYLGAGALMRDRLVAVTLVSSSIAVSMSNVRRSFLPLYFDEIGWTASAIGLVMSITAAAGIASRALHSTLDRRLRSWVYMGACLVIGAASLAVTVATTATTLIVGAMAVSGFALGAANPITLTMLARSVAPHRRGLGVGLRVTTNRLGSTSLPLVFSAAAAAGGLRLATVVLSSLTALVGGLSANTLRRITRSGD